MRTRLIKYTPYIAFGVGLNYINNLDIYDTKKIAFTKGYDISQKFKKYPAFDKYVEPYIINNFSLLFAIGNSFIKGLISDNKPDKVIDESIDEMKKKVVEELNTFKKKT